MQESLKAIRLLVLDVDGVLTDGSIWIGPDGSDLKRFSIADGLGLKLLLQAGIHVAILSGHASESTVRRFKGLGIEDVEVGVVDKLPHFEALLAKHGIAPSEVAAMGDDLPDLPVLRAAGWSATVPAAPPEVKAVTDLVTERAGGEGAVREVVEMILRAQGRFDEFVESC